mgnify:FL=1
MVITFEKVSFRYIEKKLLNEASFSFTDQDKIGVVGKNGCGKSTLLKLIWEEEKPISGKIIKSGGIRFGILPQQPVFSKGRTILEEVMRHSTSQNPILPYEAKSILTKLGLTDLSVLTDVLSGGEAKRLALAIVLVTPCDFLLLDEPTNHLDNGMIEWLEKYLQKWKKGLLMVTHDRYFLQRVCHKIMELENGKTYLYEMGFDAFLEEKARRLENTEKANKKLKQILLAEKEWINRGVEARRTKSKKRLERFEQLSKIEFKEEKQMAFSSLTTYLGKKLIEIKNGQKRYGNKILFRDFSFSLQRSDIIGVVGANGAGKSTFFKILMQQEPLDSGELILGETLKIGYFSQHLDLIDPEIRVMDYIDDQWVETLEGSISASELLERFLFDKTLQYSKVKMLSGGEKRRLQLVKVLIGQPNVLILDEPTNDLDIYTMEILEDFLLNFKGPILLVSHDRYFLDKVCNQLLVFENATIAMHSESFSEFLMKEKTEFFKKETKKPVVKNKMPASLRNEYQQIQQQITHLEEEINDLQEQIASQTTDFHKIMELQSALDEKQKTNDRLIERYVELEEIKNQYPS